MTESDDQHHHWWEDALALPFGTLLMAIGVLFFTKATVLTGGIAGLALLLTYANSIGFDLWFFILNLPFYWLAVRRMGWQFTLKTFAAVTLISIWVRLVPGWIDIADIHPLFAAIAGGSLIGIGMLTLLRHRAGVGGINILAQYLQERHNIRAGYVQLGFDTLILVASFLVIDIERVAYSIVGAVVLNMILAINHRPGRYRGFS